MAIDIDIAAARAALDALFAEVETKALAASVPAIAGPSIPQFDVIFETRIQGYREALLGLALARLQSREIDLRLPYVNQGGQAFHARELDEQAVNPFFQTHRIPSSGGPYLAMFRRDFKFEAAQRPGQKDKRAYDAFLALISELEARKTVKEIRAFITYALYRFAKLREGADLPLSRLQRISLEQYGILIIRLLATPSGVRLPVIIVVAAFRAINEYFGKNWSIEHQGINVADRPSGAGGDVTIKESHRVVFAIEITERPLDRARVIATFNNNIAPNGIEDYLFFVRLEKLSPGAEEQARQYFAQGSDVNFLEIETWVMAGLATIGKRGRELFNEQLLNLIGGTAIPPQLKVAWNNYIDELTRTA
jgi:hypothetical protein